MALMFTLIMLLLYLFLLLQSVAFYTLLERHVLGLTQGRFGPKKTSWYGLLQPIVDGLKLVKKEQVLTFNCSPSVFLGVALFTFSLFYAEFLCLPYWFVFLTVNWSYLLVIVLLGVNVYFLIMAGVYSKSKYAYLGGIRASVASVSYEVSFILCLLILILYSKAYTVTWVGNIGLLLVLPTYFTGVLVELGRTPFDYAESESELVSGFNTEYSSVGFVLLFLKEYGSLLFLSVFTSVVYFNGYLVGTITVFTLFILLRSSFPRVRYDKLIGVIWLQLVFHVGVIFYTTFYMVIL